MKVEPKKGSTFAYLRWEVALSFYPQTIILSHSSFPLSCINPFNTLYHFTLLSCYHVQSLVLYVTKLYLLPRPASCGRVCKKSPLCISIKHSISCKTAAMTWFCIAKLNSKLPFSQAFQNTTMGYFWNGQFFQLLLTFGEPLCCTNLHLFLITCFCIPSLWWRWSHHRFYTL